MNRTQHGIRRIPAPRRRPVREAGRRPRVFNLLVIIAVVTLGLVVSSRQAALAELSYEVADLKNEVAALSARVEREQLEVARLKSLDRIEQIAVTRLGMVRPEAVRLVQVPASRPAEVVVAGGRPGVAEAASVGGQPGATTVTGVISEAFGRLIPVLGRAEAHQRQE